MPRSIAHRILWILTWPHPRTWKDRLLSGALIGTFTFAGLYFGHVLVHRCP